MTSSSWIEDNEMISYISNQEDWNGLHMPSVLLFSHSLQLLLLQLKSVKNLLPFGGKLCVLAAHERSAQKSQIKIGLQLQACDSVANNCRCCLLYGPIRGPVLKPFFSFGHPSSIRPFMLGPNTTLRNGLCQASYPKSPPLFFFFPNCT